MKLFVYGTLKRGFFNNQVLGDSPFVRDAVIWGFTLIDLGPFPGLVAAASSVVGEVFEVDKKTLSMVDQLDGNGRLYTRIKVDIGNGEWAYTYLYCTTDPCMAEWKQ